VAASLRYIPFAGKGAPSPRHLYTGGVLFKVYIVGDAIRVVCRFSLPNVDEGDMSNNAGVFRFPRVSCATSSANDFSVGFSVALENTVGN
jgi:hypothetical protein